MSEKSQISSFYASKKIFITGSTGFMGKVLLWKLLDSCPELDAIYVLMRPKYGKSSMLRKEQLFSSAVFDDFKKTNPEIFEKVVLVSGDVAEDGIGLSDADRNTIIDGVSIIFHSAAILKMNSDLRTSVNVNTLGTARMLDMAKKMKKLEGFFFRSSTNEYDYNLFENLKAFVYISTAYCCCENSTVEEKIYPSKHNPYEIINITKWMEPDLLDKITPKLIYPLPNTYIYSKRLTESLLQSYVSEVPIIVARPSIVVASFKEPFPGWIDSLNGPTGFFAAGARGVLRTTMLNFETPCDIIPVDIAINGILTLPWANSKEQLLKQIMVYNISKNAHENLTWGEVIDNLMAKLEKYPLNMMCWYPNSDLSTKSVFIYTFKLIFLHYLPAYVIDFVLMIGGQKPFLVNVQDRIRHGEKMLKYFTQQSWSFVHDNLLRLEKQFNDTDKQLFNVHMRAIDNFESYYEDVMIASKIHIFKEDLNKLDDARRTTRIMYIIDKIVLVLRYYFLWKLIMFAFDMVLRIIN